MDTNGSVEKKSSISQTDSANTPSAFSHTFDLTKRLTHPNLSNMNYITLPPTEPSISPYSSILQNISTSLSTTPPSTLHRLIIPSLLSPALYPPQSSQPTHLLQFLHSLRALLSTHNTRLTVMLSLPLSLYPRMSGLVRWIELLSDGVLELAPFPHSSSLGAANSTSGAATSQEEPPQGMMKVHRLPIFHERGGGNPEGMTEDWAFTLSRRKFAIKPFSLPPLEGDNEAQRGEVADSKPKAANMEF
jgi:elongator complex protein 4